MDFSKMDETQIILPTGQSGLPNSPHYKDQAKLYNRGKYRTTFFSKKSLFDRKELRRLVLSP